MKSISVRFRLVWAEVGQQMVSINRPWSMILNYMAEETGIFYKRGIWTNNEGRDKGRKQVKWEGRKGLSFLFAPPMKNREHLMKARKSVTLVANCFSKERPSPEIVEGPSDICPYPWLPPKPIN